MNDNSEKLALSITEARRHLDFLDASAEKFDFQIYDDNRERSKKSKIGNKGYDPRARTIYGTLDEVFPRLRAANEDGCAVHVTVNRTQGAQRLAKQIVRVRAHFVEIDGVKTLPEILAGPLRPARINESSPGKYHVYFRVADDVATDLQGFRLRQARLAVLYGGGPESIDLPRVLRLPGFMHQKDPSAPFPVSIVHDDPDAPVYCIDDFDLVLPDEAVSANMNGGAMADASESAIEPDQPANIERAIEYLVNDAERSIEGQGGERAMFKVACSLRDIGISQFRAFDLVMEHFNRDGICVPLWEPDELEKKIANAYKYASLAQLGGRSAEADFRDDDAAEVASSIPDSIMGDPSITAERAAAEADARKKRSEMPTITVEMGDLPNITRRVQRLLIKDGERSDCAPTDMIFQRNGNLVHLSRNRLADGAAVDRQYHVEDDLLVNGVEEGWLADRTERCITFGRTGKKKGASGKSPPTFIPTAAPPILINRLHSIKPDWKYPHLAGTIETPTMRTDGTILDRAGYDKKSGLYFDPGRDMFPPIKSNPTKDDALAALTVLREPIRDFDFADEDGVVRDITQSESVTLSMMLTGVVRRQLHAAPMFGIDANLAQSGKTELAQVVSVMMTGRQAACRPLPQEEYHRSNALAAAFGAGDPIILFDNIDGDKQNIEGESLCMAITAPTFQMRRLGGNGPEDQVTVPTNAVLVATGNKLTAAGDMTEGRMLMIRLRPYKPLAERKFAHRPLRAYVAKQRPQLVAAALTILRAYAISKDPRPPVTFRLEEWQEKIGNALVWLGLPDPTRSADGVKDADPVAETQREVLTAFVSQFGDRELTSKQLCLNDSVRQAIADARGLDQRRVNPTIVGRYLLGMKGVPLLGYSLEQRKQGHTGASMWRIVKGENATAIEPVPPYVEREDDFGVADAVDEFNVATLVPDNVERQEVTLPDPWE